MGGVSNWLAKSDIKLSEQTVLWWGGLRGSVSIALALSVPIALPERDKVIAVVFGVVLFTLLVQGLTTKTLLQRLGLLGEGERQQEYVEASARRAAMEQVLERLYELEGNCEFDREFYDYQVALVKGQIDDIQKDMRTMIDHHPDLRDFAKDRLREELLSIEADTYAQLVRGGRLAEELSPFLQDVMPPQTGEGG